MAVRTLPPPANLVRCSCPLDDSTPRAYRMPCPAPHGRWLVAGTLLGGRYPCRCRADKRCDPVWCPDAGREDLDHVPAGCCGHRVRAHHVAEALLGQRARVHRTAETRTPRGPG